MIIFATNKPKPMQRLAIPVIAIPSSIIIGSALTAKNLRSAKTNDNNIAPAINNIMEEKALLLDNLVELNTS